MNNEKVTLLLELMHGLSNRFVVIQKVMNLYAEQLPEHQLTKIGIESLEKAIDMSKQIKDLAHQIEVEIENENAIQVHLPKKKVESNFIKDFITSIKTQKKSWEENFNLKILLPSQLEQGLNEEISKSSLNQFLDLTTHFLEHSAINNASAIEYTYAVGPEKFIINLFDNSEGVHDESSESMQKLKAYIEEQSLVCRVNSMRGIGNGLTLEIPLVNK